MHHSFLPDQRYQVATFYSSNDGGNSARDQANAFMQTIPGSNIIKLDFKIIPGNTYHYWFVVEYKK